MPPKAASKKADQKQKQKVIEDKTFGLKNKKKSSKVQKYVQSVEKQVSNTAPPKEPKKSKAEVEKEKKTELNSLFKVAQTKVPKGVDPKSVLCEFFKLGTCTKGSKCKFSHDLEVGRKAEKIDIYTDTREAEKEADTMDKWDDQKLNTVVDSKQGQENKNLKTDIVCKYFLEAIETKKYGWFWECPNGGQKCIYRHALPPGFVLNKKEEQQEVEEVPLEEIIEEERAKLTTHTPVTLERFLKWKVEKEEKKKQVKEAAEKKKVDDFKAGKKGAMSGREMFTYNPELFVDDEEALDDTGYARDEETVPEVILSATGTSISYVRKNAEGEENDGTPGSSNIEVNESLFTGDDLPEEEEEEEEEEDAGEDEEENEGKEKEEKENGEEEDG